MTWVVETHYSGPNALVLHILSTAANDTELIIAHDLGHVPYMVDITPHNAQANNAGYWFDDETDKTVHLHKPNGGANSLVHVTLLTFRHPH